MYQADPLVSRYFASFEKLYDVLPRQEERKLFKQWKHKKDKTARETILNSNLKFVVKQANKYRSFVDNKAITINDIIQAGNLGLLEAIDHFKIGKNVRFITYAVHWVNAYIRMFIYRNVTPVQVGLNNRTKIMIDQKWTVINLLNGKDGEALDEFRKKFRKKYKISAKQMTNEEEKVQSLFGVQSMDAAMRIGNDAEDTVNLHNKISSSQFNTEHLVENKEEQDLIKKKIKKALRRLIPRDREIIKMRYLQDDDETMTLANIGKKYNVSRERIRQLESRALELMKDNLKDDETVQEVLQLQ